MRPEQRVTFATGLAEMRRDSLLSHTDSCSTDGIHLTSPYPGTAETSATVAAVARHVQDGHACCDLAEGDKGGRHRGHHADISRVIFMPAP